jgi:hypothetical protein
MSNEQFETALDALRAIANHYCADGLDRYSSSKNAWKDLAVEMAARAQEALDIINKEEV